MIDTTMTSAVQQQQLMYHEHMMKLHQGKGASKPAKDFRGRRGSSSSSSSATSALASEYENRLSEWRIAQGKGTSSRSPECVQSPESFTGSEPQSSEQERQGSRRVRRSSLTLAPIKNVVEPENYGYGFDAFGIKEEPRHVPPSQGIRPRRVRRSSLTLGMGTMGRKSTANLIEEEEEERKRAPMGTHRSTANLIEEEDEKWNHGVSNEAIVWPPYPANSNGPASAAANEAFGGGNDPTAAVPATKALGMRKVVSTADFLTSSTSSAEESCRGDDSEELVEPTNLRKVSSAAGFGFEETEHHDQAIKQKSDRRGRRARRMSMSYKAHSEEPPVVPRKKRSKLGKSKRSRAAAVKEESLETGTGSSEFSPHPSEELKPESTENEQVVVVVPFPPMPEMQRRRSSLKSESSASSFLSDDDSASKSVRFGTAEKHSVDVKCSVTLIEKPDKSLREILWWTQSELDHRCRLDTEIASLVDKRYDQLLCKAIKSAEAIADDDSFDDEDDDEDAVRHNAALAVHLCFQTMQDIAATARGLEAEVCQEFVDRQDDHRRAVLSAQKFLLDEGDASLSAIQMVLRQQSLKHSRASQLVAAKIAEFDHSSLVLEQ